MRFEQPLWLLLIPLALVGGWFAYRLTEPKRAALAFPQSDILARAGGRAWLYRVLPYAVNSLALVLCAVALARPQSVIRQEDSTSQGIDIMLVLDTSTSMRAIDFNPLDRMAAAKETAKRFIAGRLHDRIGILVFGSAAILACPLTTDYQSL